MGLYFNTKTTRDMQSKVNDAFEANNIDFWKNFAQRKHFQKQNGGGKPLHTIAAQNGIVPDEGDQSTPGQKWKKWLKDLESDTKDQLRDLFFKHLDPSRKCVELIFVPILKGSMPITILECTPIPVDAKGAYSQTIEIHTPTARVVRAAIKRRQELIAKKRAAAKKKI